MKIMVVDDERDIETLFRQRFRKEIKENLLDFHFAFSGEEALDYLRQKNPTDVVLILSDINMPGMSGIELLKILKEDFSHLKVFMITAYDDKEKYEKAIAYGAEEFLAKPIDFEKLKKAMFDILNNRN